ILNTFLEKNVYFLNDLGDIQVLNWLNTNRKNNFFSDKAIILYKKILVQLIKIQIDAGNSIDYSLSYPNSNFDQEAILYDLNYFKNKFLLKTNINFNETSLAKDFDFFSNYLLQTNCSFFMYRDFQARNIMLVGNEPYFIDYQGGRKGALQYDLASLLYQAKAEIPKNTKNLLLNYYIKNAKTKIDIDSNEFKKYYYAYALIRVLQTLGAYGYRGLVEKKQHFIDSIPYAINNLSDLKNEVIFLKDIPELSKTINTLIHNKYTYEY
nr:phosphotransferase [Bacteroidales bacterium]